MEDGKLEAAQKRDLAIRDFSRLIGSGEVGFYQSCEVTQVILHYRADRKIVNFFTVACLSESPPIDGDWKNITSKLKPISKELSVGVVQKSLSLKQTTSLFESLQEGKFEIGSKPAIISEQLILLPKQFVPSLWGTRSPILSDILKTNFYGSNYIVEFFDEDKSLYSELSRDEIEKVHAEIAACEQVKINFEKPYERLGGIVFQFPITLLAFDWEPLPGYTEILLKSSRHPKLENDVALTAMFKASKDNVVSGYHTINFNTGDKKVQCALGDFNNIELTVAKDNSDILLYHSRQHLLPEIRTNMMFSMAHAEPRTLKTSDSVAPIELPVGSPMPMTVGRRRRNDYLDYISRRENENEILIKSGDYKVCGEGDRNEALTMLRKKIKSASSMKELCLWDPYLNAQDIIDTLYFETSGIPFRCITSLKGLKKIAKQNSQDSTDTNNAEDSAPVSFETIKLLQTQLFKDLSNNMRVNLDFRCQHNNHGYAFHDRFLVLVPADENDLPSVYSLGSSVNGIGKMHHIIQKITDPRVILRDFNKLWEQLPARQCQIVQFPARRESQ